MSEEIQEKTAFTEESVMPLETELEKEPTGLVYDKNELLDKTVDVQVLGLIKNRWGKWELDCKIEDQQTRLRLSKANKNELIDILGKSLKDWVGKTVKVSGSMWEGDIDGRQSVGVTLHFE